jgi:hypothetical protein
VRLADSFKLYFITLLCEEAKFLKKNKFVKFESLDGEIHFQECKADFCMNAQGYNEEEAIEFARNEARKTLLLQRE